MPEKIGGTRSLVAFFVIAYVWAWLFYVPMAVVHAPPQWAILATLGPTIAAVVVHRIEAGNYRVVAIFKHLPGVLVGTAVGVALMLLAYVVLPALTTANPRKLHWSVLGSVAVYNYSTLLGGPLFEEPGWRGFALPRLEPRYGPMGATLVLAPLWAGWHLPLLFYPGWISASWWVYLLFILGSSVILTFVTNLARFSVVAPIVTHAVFNTASRFLNGMFAGEAPNVRIVPFELIMALGGLTIATVLIFATRGQLAYAQGRRIVADAKNRLPVS
jgi:membrane protease YdiL (CAAX protease family)